MPLDDATTRFLTAMAEAGGKPMHEMSLEEARLTFAGVRELFGPGPEMARVEDTMIKAEDGGTFGVRILTPVETPRAVILYYHGGGWVLGTPDDFEPIGRCLAAGTGCTVVLVDYRLAPEHRFPTAPRDAYTALLWAAETFPGAPIIVAGDSAGANLSTVVARRARDEGGPAIALQVLVYPATNCDLDAPSYHDPENQLLLTRDLMIWFWDHYAPDPADRAHPDASPLRAADLSGLPPAVILTAEYDVLRDEDEAYAERLREAGVPVELTRLDGQMHGFFNMVGLLPGSAAAVDVVVKAVRKSLG